MDGLRKIKPSIKKINFLLKGKMTIELNDGRIVSVPIHYFPSIKKLSSEQRKKWYILDDEMFSFDDSNEVFHIEQVLGKENIYRYTFMKKKEKA